MKGTLLTGTGMFLYFGEVFAQLQELTNRAFSSLQSSESSRYKLPIFIFRKGVKTKMFFWQSCSSRQKNSTTDDFLGILHTTINCYKVLA